eukprot:CAMPEP_0194037932 /NCGR_PEP_ID=MMETSP0009_2-20130614/10241_1 /TAXON_ID=210454 /ORGANISM="Grammatophora oceanica, Strain CCMP 410" /LENGTH=64 /DNA_ID=CAMNT_0038680277 /DNA_START=723 /DNA_END=914 /DNA_ORIENTATION=-
MALAFGRHGFVPHYYLQKITVYVQDWQLVSSFRPSHDNAPELSLLQKKRFPSDEVVGRIKNKGR